MGALSKIQNATPTNGGNNIKDGNYLYLIEKVTYDERARGGATFIAEFRVMEAEANGATDEKKKGETGKPSVPNPVGSTCSMVCQLDKFENAGGNALAFLLGAMGPLGYIQDNPDLTPEERAQKAITEPRILEVSGTGNPLRGVAVRNETYRGWNKGKSVPANRDNTLTLNSWKQVAQTPADIQACRAWLDSNAARTVAPAPAAPAAVAQPVAPATPAPQPTPTTLTPAPAAPAVSNLLAQLGIAK